MVFPVLLTNTNQNLSCLFSPKARINHTDQRAAIGAGNKIDRIPIQRHGDSRTILAKGQRKGLSRLAFSLDLMLTHPNNEIFTVGAVKQLTND